MDSLPINDIDKTSGLAILNDLFVAFLQMRNGFVKRYLHNDINFVADYNDNPILTYNFDTSILRCGIQWKVSHAASLFITDLIRPNRHQIVYMQYRAPAHEHAHGNVGTFLIF